VPVALATSSRVVAATSSAARLKSLADPESYLGRTGPQAAVRLSDSDSGRSSLASSDNHSIGSDMSPTLNLNLNLNSNMAAGHHHSSSRFAALQPKPSGM
jgi:hypothetical protein